MPLSPFACEDGSLKKLLVRILAVDVLRSEAGRDEPLDDEVEGGF